MAGRQNKTGIDWDDKQQTNKYRLEWLRKKKLAKPSKKYRHLKLNTCFKCGKYFLSASSSSRLCFGCLQIHNRHKILKWKQMN